MDAVALVDCPVPILDISTGLSIDPFSSRELNHCHKGSLSPCYSSSPSCLLLTDRRIYAPECRPERVNLRTRSLQAKHDHPTAGPFGYNKTLEWLRRDCVWPSMRTDCKEFALQCVLCARNKPPRHRPYSLLQPLPVPGRPWHSISMDFVEHLPTSNGLS